MAPEHSLLLVTKDEDIPLTELGNLLQNGIKILLFTNTDENLIHFDNFIVAKLLQVYILDIHDVVHNQSFSIIDGQINSISKRRQLKKIAELCNRFNIEQYLVEHAPINSHLNVEAGAGTGKTTVMIQRILFILHKTNVPLSEIVMITFTKDASQRMFQKLREEFYRRFQATGAVKYLAFIEELRVMRISTIHSFARQLIKELGSKMGYGSNVRIKSFKVERSSIIEKNIDQLVGTWAQDGNLSDRFNKLPLYEIIAIADSFWEEMERKGLTTGEVKDLLWGTGTINSQSESLHELFSSIFHLCEDELQQKKIDSNAISLSDLTRQLDFITEDQSTFHNNANRMSFLFIDEFQDTDDIQIKLASRLVSAFGLKLFVVGDIKQSIYRFRGARYTAFHILKRQLAAMGEKVRNYPLRTNYRSLIPLLIEMDSYFMKWATKGYLPYGIKDRLTGIKLGYELKPFRLDRVSFDRFSKEQEAYTVKFIQEARTSIKDTSKDKLAVLVRTNSQALYIQQWCEKVGINTQLNIGGTFYSSPAIKEFKFLIEGLLFPNSPVALLNLLNSSYSDTKVEWTVLPPFDGDASALSTYLHSLRPLGDWKQCLEDLRVTPVLAVIRKILDKMQPATRYYLQELDKLNLHREGEPNNEIEAHARAKQYQLNLNHLFELIHSQFGTDFITLFSLHGWLQLQIATNRDEDEPELDETDQLNRISVMTVHKSKGLEFHTVLVPFTDKVFRYATNELLLEKAGEAWQAGWFIRDGNDKYGSLIHSLLQSIESDEATKEETRLLYVAMTRAEHRLWIIGNREYHWQDNWNKLLSLQEASHG